MDRAAAESVTGFGVEPEFPRDTRAVAAWLSGKGKM
jgi:hypothetical protein